MTTGGKLTCAGADITGKITASSGYIGGTSGWHIASNKIYSGTVDSGTANGDITLSTGDFSRSIGGTSRSSLRLAIGKNFGVTNDGSLYTSNITASNEFHLGGSNGINSGDGKISVGSSMVIDTSNGAITVTGKDQNYFKFNTGLWVKNGNLITDGGSIRSTDAIHVGTSDTSSNWNIRLTTSKALFKVPVSVANSLEVDKIYLNTDGEITCTKLTSSGNISCDGTLSCSSFSPSSITASGDIKSSYSSDRYARMGNNDYINSNYSAVVETRYGSTRYVRMSTGSNSSYFEAYYNSSHYTTIDGYYGITVVGGSITAPSLSLSGGISGATNISASGNISCSGTLSCGSFSPSSISTGSISATSLSLSGKITGATYITASHTIKGKELESDNGLSLNGAISGATDITASGTIKTGGSSSQYIKMEKTSTGLSLSVYYSSSYYTTITDEGITMTGNITANRYIGNVDTYYTTNIKPVGSYGSSGQRIGQLASNSSGQLVVRGDFSGSNASTRKTYNSSDSDARLKEDIADTLIDGIDIIRKIKHKQFTWKDTHRHVNIGYIAQELESVNSGLVFPPETDDDMYSINTLYLQAVTTKALQELITEVDTLKTRIAELEEVKEK